MATKAVAGYVRGMRTAIRENAGAYGYSVMITSTFAILTVAELSVTVPRILLFAAAAGVAFALIEALGSNFFRDRMVEERPDVVALGAAFAVFAIMGGAGTAALVTALLDGWPAWAAAPFAATIAYLVLEGAEIALARRAAGG